MSRGDETAFPTELSAADSRSGLTIREYFAAMAMQGLTQCRLTPEDMPADMTWRELIAKTSVQLADALLAELAKPVTP